MNSATQNATGLTTTCSVCGDPYSPAFRPTHGPAVCSLCAIKRDLAVALRTEELIEENKERTQWLRQQNS
jgi:uncharacterized Zn finger protein (UPF0148 family)